ncbi:PTS sugar transporter subunit IIA [Clostridium sp.]|nr:PTS sugar transporter subunit IIA [Clostridium sp.]MDF2505671.1 hypothetical protein [Clostridium sp.]
MIKKLLNKETIEVNIKAENWEEAVRKGGTLLKDAGKIENSYIDVAI